MIFTARTAPRTSPIAAFIATLDAIEPPAKPSKSDWGAPPRPPAPSTDHYWRKREHGPFLSALHHHYAIFGLHRMAHGALRRGDYAKATVDAQHAINIYRKFVRYRPRDFNSQSFHHHYSYAWDAKEFLSTNWHKIKTAEFNSLADNPSRLIASSIRSASAGYKAGRPSPAGRRARLPALIKKTIIAYCRSRQAFLYRGPSAPHASANQLRHAVERAHHPLAPDSDRNAHTHRRFAEPGNLSLPPITGHNPKPYRRSRPRMADIARQFTQTALRGALVEHRLHLTALPQEAAQRVQTTQHIETITRLYNENHPAPPRNAYDDLPF